MARKSKERVRIEELLRQLLENRKAVEDKKILAERQIKQIDSEIQILLSIINADDKNKGDGK